MDNENLEIAFKDISFKFDDQFGSAPQRNSSVKTNGQKVSDEENYQRNFQEKLNSSTPKKRISDARSNFFGLADEVDGQKATSQDSSTMEENNTSDLLTDMSVVSSQGCDINNNDSKKPEVESGLGSISSTNDEPESKNLGEREELLSSQDDDDQNCASGDIIKGKKNVILSTTQGTTDSFRNPAQAVYMSTTVPQNIKGNKIMGRHTPSRSSLRHSRMLVINKNFQGALNPLNIFHPRWAKFCLALQILLGLLATAIGLWLLLWAPNTRIQDNPYWSGLILILSGSMGVVVMEFKRIPRNKSRESCFRFLKINFLVVLVLAILVSLAASVFALIHAASLLAVNTVCMPANIYITLSSTCVCVFGKVRVSPAELEIDKSFLDNNHTITEDHRIFSNLSGSQFHYKDLNCNEVRGPWKILLLASSITNLIGFSAALAFLIFYYRGQRQVNLYASVQQPKIATVT